MSSSPRSFPGDSSSSRDSRHECEYCKTVSSGDRCQSCGAPRTRTKPIVNQPRGAVRGKLGFMAAFRPTLNQGAGDTGPR